MKVLISDKIHQDAIVYLKEKGFAVIYQPDISAPDLLIQISRFDCIIVRSRTRVTKEVIFQGKNLKLIARAGSGTDNIDLAAAKDRKIAVINAAGANSQAVAELTIGLILTLIRNIPYADQEIKQGKWPKGELIGSEISNKTVGVIGFGNVGKKVAALAGAFGAKVLICNSHSEEDQLIKIMKKADFVCLHLSLTDKTRGIIDKAKISLMKKSAYVINSARGEIIVEEDLYQALVNRQIAGASLDVFWQEPLRESSRWRKLTNVVLTPHIGGSTVESQKKAGMMVAVDLVKFFNREVINSRVI